MGRMISAFYSPDDNFENAGYVVVPPPNGNVGPAFNNITFTPPAMACNRPVLPYSPADTQQMIAACFSPANGFRYFFYCSAQTNDIHWVGFDKNWHHVKTGTVKQVQQPKLPGSILDIAVFFSDGNINMATLGTNGDVTLLVGSPWAAPNAVWASAFLYNIPGAKRIAVFDGAGAGHIIVSTEFDLIEIWYFYNGGVFGKNPLGTFRQAILDIGACLTPGDGVAHVFVANAPSQLQELVWIPAEVPPKVNQIGFVDFVIGSIGAYTKLGDKHLIIRDAGDDLFLSWFDAGSPLIRFGPWPQTHAC
jgi:hypothetical protein